MLQITVNELKNGDAYEACQSSDTIFHTLYDTEAQKQFSEEDFVETLPEALQVGMLINEFVGPDEFEEAISFITAQASSPQSAAWWQKKIPWALEQIGQTELVTLVKKAISEYTKQGELSKETEDALFQLDPHDSGSGSVYDSLGNYIKKHAKEIVTKDYIKKTKQMTEGPAHKTKQYTNVIKKKYPWFKIK